MRNSDYLKLEEYEANDKLSLLGTFNTNMDIIDTFAKEQASKTEALDGDNTINKEDIETLNQKTTTNGNNIETLTNNVASLQENAKTQATLNTGFQSALTNQQNNINLANSNISELQTEQNNMKANVQNIGNAASEAIQRTNDYKLMGLTFTKYITLNQENKWDNAVDISQLLTPYSDLTYDDYRVQIDIYAGETSADLNNVFSTYTYNLATLTSPIDLYETNGNDFPSYLIGAYSLVVKFKTLNCTKITCNGIVNNHIGFKITTPYLYNVTLRATAPNENVIVDSLDTHGVPPVITVKLTFITK